MKLFLCGGGSGEKTENVINKLNEIIPHDKPILYVPLAMDEKEHSYDDCFRWIRGELSSVQVPYIDMCRSFEELAKKNYSDYSAIFIGGGNSFKLLKGLKNSGSFYKMKDYINNDGIIFGGSAGAVVLGYDINSCLSMDGNDCNLIDTRGFDVLDGVSVFAHYLNHSSKRTEEENNLRDKKFTNALRAFSSEIGEVIALPEEDTLFIDGKNVVVIGTQPYYRFKSGTRYQIDINFQNSKDDN